MQTLGTEWGREVVHSDIWVALLMERYSKSATRDLFITDVRFDNEAKWIEKQGGQVFLIVRPHHDKLDKHKSEEGINEKYLAGVIFNDKSVDDLKDIATYYAGVSKETHED